MSYREGRFWQPDVTVATIVVDDGRLLCVEERVNGHLVINQPAGHLEPDESLEQAAEEGKKCANVRVRGLMCIPPVAEGEHGSLPYFEKVHALFVDINAKLYDNTLDILSMGMSGDYEDAVRAGATMVRVGTAIFGARNYTI